MNQHEMRVWHFVGQYAAKPRLPGRVENGVEEKFLIDWVLFHFSISFR